MAATDGYAPLFWPAVQACRAVGAGRAARAAGAARAALAALAAAGLLGACASSPYTNDTRPVTLRMAAPAEPAARGTLAYAIDYADDTYAAYRAKLVEEQARRQQLSNGLLTLGTLLVGAAVGNAHRDVLTTGALGAGLAYQLGTWNSNADRLDIYLEGMKAMACAKAAVAPLRWSADTRAVIAKVEGDVLRQMQPMAAALADTSRWLNVAGASQTPNSDTAQLARAEMAEAAALFTQLNELLKRSTGLVQKADGAGATLEARIDEIRRQIDQALKGSQASLSALPQQIASLTQYANVFAPGLKLDTVFQERIAKLNNPPAAPGAHAPGAEARNAGKPGAKPDTAAPLPIEPRDQLAEALGRLQATRGVLGVYAARLSGATDRATGQAQSDLAGCGVDSAKLAPALQLDRSQLEIPAGKPRQSRVAISGGTKPFNAVALDSPMTGIQLLVPAGSTEVLVIADTTTVAGSSYKVRVEDAAEHSALLTLRVGDAAGTAQVTSPASQQCTGQGWNNRTLVCFTQHHLGLSPTGTLNTGTCTGFVDRFPQAAGVLDDTARGQVLLAEKMAANASEADMRRRLNDDELNKCDLTKRTDESRRTSAKPQQPVPLAGARTDFERKLGPGEIRTISKAIGMASPVSELTPEFRRALGSYQQRHGLPDTKGSVTDEFARKFL